MQALDRKAIFDALFARLKDELAGDILDFQRSWVGWFGSDRQPALLLEATQATNRSSPNEPPVCVLGASVAVYAELAESDPSPEDTLFDLAAKVEVALRRKPSEPLEMAGGDEDATTLGGLVLSVRVLTIDFIQGGQGGGARIDMALQIVAPVPDA